MVRVWKKRSKKNGKISRKEEGRGQWKKKNSRNLLEKDYETFSRNLLEKDYETFSRKKLDIKVSKGDFELK
jgi:hypothetical protein